MWCFKQSKSSRRFLILSAFIALGLSSEAQATTTHFSWENPDIHSLQQALRNHQLTCVQIVKHYLGRIQRYDFNAFRKAPLNAIVNINPSVLNDAARLDQYYQTHHKFVGSLQCVPILLKDNIDSYDSTSASGSLALIGSQPNKDAFLTAKLRQAGAIILGKGSMDEFAAGMSGISSLSGRTGNAYDSNQNSGGSSSGPAVAVSAGFALAAIGTDNSGSVRVPAAFNGVDGLRPSTGLISQSGIFPRGNLDGVAGPITNNIQDMAAVLSVVAQADKKDSKTSGVPRVKNYNDYLNAQALQHKRIGVVHMVGSVNPFDVTNKATLTIFNQALTRLRKQGAILVDIRLPKFNADRKNNTAGEVSAINNYLASFPSTRRNFTGICESDRTRTFGGSVADCLQFIKNDPKKDSKAYYQVLKIFADNRRYVLDAMRKDKLDALLMPISATGAASDDVTHVNTARASLSSNTGLPAMTLNVGFTKAKPRMPVAFELIGKMYAEPTLIAMGYAYQQHSPTRLLPSLQNLKHASVLSTMNIAQMNNFFRQVGMASYQQVLKNGQASDLTARAFRRIAIEQVESLKKLS